MDNSDCLKALVKSKPRRVQEVLKNGGNATKSVTMMMMMMLPLFSCNTI
jgi:hypothetical protein